MTYALLSMPAAEPLTLGDVKAHLRIDTTDEDGLLTGLIRVAREHLERATGLMLITQSFRLYLDSVSEDGIIRVLKGPLQRLDAIRIYDAAGFPVELDVSAIPFERGVVAGRILAGSGLITSRAIQGVEVDFTGGFGASGNEVPDSIRRALLLHVAAMFEYRGAVALADQPAVLPDGYERLLGPFQMRRL